MTQDVENTHAVQTLESFTFGGVDYVVFIFMLLVSAGIGVYFGFFSKSKNTTEEYLMGGKRMKTIPIAISLVASQLSGLAIMAIPAENYSFGFNYIFVVVSMVAVVPILCYVIIPVFYENKISNCYEYLEMRFNKRTRQLVTCSFILNGFLMLPVYMFIPSLAFSQVTGINVHLINTVVCAICVFYTMLGGIKAVVWTDVVQAGIMISSVVLVGVLGTIKIGGLGQVLENASAGGRLNVDYSWDPRVRLSFWNASFTGVLMWVGHVGLNQSCVQRIVSLPSIDKAKRSLFIAGVGFVIIMGFNCFIGILMFARYYGCDPILAGLVEKADKLMPFFVQDVMGHLKGMPGIFISCVFSASLSTMSAMMNSMAGVVYFDYIKPFIKHTEARANFIMKIFVVATGCYCILGGLVVQHFKSILQIHITIAGVNTGAVVGVFLLGMFVPRVKGKVAMVSVLCSVAFMMWVISNARNNFRTGLIRYDPLPTTLDQCKAHSLHSIVKSLNLSQNFTEAVPLAESVTSEEPELTTAFSSNRDFSIFDVSFYLYKVLGALVVWLVAIPLSYIWKPHEDEKLNPHLYSPFVRKFLKKQIIEMEEQPLKGPYTTVPLPEKQPQNGNGVPHEEH